MSARALLAGLREAGVRVWSDGDRLRLDAPAGTLSPTTLDQLRALKVQMLELLSDEAPAIASPARALRWSSPMAGLIGMLDRLQPEDLPPEFRIRPGVIVKHPVRFLAALRVDVAGGPGGLRARSGVLKMDLEGLARFVAARQEVTR